MYSKNINEKCNHLTLGNFSIHQHDYEKAVFHYANILIQYPELVNSFRVNLDIAIKRYRLSRSKVEKQRIAVCGWSLGHNAAGRVYTLASIYQSFADVEIIGTIFPEYGSNIWDPIQNTHFIKHYFVVNDESSFIQQAIKFTINHPYDIIHLSKPRATNIFLGIIYKLIWNAKVVMDIDDEELAFVKAERSLSLDEYLQEYGELPKLKNITGRIWTQLAVGLYDIFDSVTVSNAALKKKYEGIIIPHARNINIFNITQEYKYQNRKMYSISKDKKVVLFFGTPREHKGLEKVAKAIAKLKSKNILYLIVGSFSDINLKRRLQSIKNCNFMFLSNQPIDNIPEILSLADCCVLFQDNETLEGKYQTPAKLSDALCAGLPVIVNKTYGLDYFIDNNCVILSDEESLPNHIFTVLFDSVNIGTNSLNKMRDFISIENCADKLINMLRSDHNIIDDKNSIKFYTTINTIRKGGYYPLNQIIPPSNKKIYGEFSSFVSEHILPEDISLKDIKLYFHVQSYIKNKSKRKAHIAVFTAISNCYDNLICPENLVEEWDYILFSDEMPPKYEGPFEIRKLNIAFNDPVRFARYVKTHPHSLLKEYDYTLWVDSNVLIRGTDLQKEVNRSVQEGILLVGRSHPERSSLSQEVEACKYLCKDVPKIIDMQVAKYYAEGFPDNLGLIETNLLLRNNVDINVSKFNELWWKEIVEYSRRDQLSIMYLLWKTSLYFKFFENIPDLRKHVHNSCCLFPHGGISNRKLPAYRQPFFMTQNLIKKDAIKKDNDIQLLYNIRDYWKSKKKPKGRVAVYTAIIGNYDVLKTPLHINTDWDYICFTDRQDFVGEHPWQIRHIDYIGRSNTVTARFIKTHPHYYLNEYQYSIWVDANILINDDKISLYEKKFEQSGKNIGVILHPQRNCTYKEGQECINRQLDDPEIINEQLKKYRECGFPDNYGLVETNILFRKHNEYTIINFNEKWWNEIERYSKRDQLSFMFVMWILKLEIMNILPLKVSTRNCSTFTRYQHNTLHNTKDSYLLPDFLKKSFAYANNMWWECKNIKLPEYFIDIYNNITVDIIICVHNALENIKECLNSIDCSLNKNNNVILIDDNSDPLTADYLTSYSRSRPYVKLLKNNIGIGYTKSANRGLKASRSDFVILLNSDTIVSKNWIKKLLHTAYSRPYIGIVGPLCSAASWQSIPFIKDPDTGKMAINTLPLGFDVDKMDTLVESSGTLPSFPLVSLINGVCYGIKREVIDTIGYFDEVSFPVGYGEEDDYSMRAQNAGFMLSVATHCYIFHAKSKSFGNDKRLKLAQQGRKKLDAKHGILRLQRAIKVTENNPILQLVRRKICNELGLCVESSTQTFQIKGNVLEYNKKKSLSNYSNITEIDCKHDTIIDEFYLSKIFQRQLEENKRFIAAIQPLWRGTPSSIAIILPQFLNILAGGVRTVIMAASNWQKYWDARISFFILRTSDAVQNKNYKEYIYSKFPNLRFDCYIINDDSQIDMLPDTDIAVCTSWPTAFFLAKYNKTKAKFYFMQDYETMFYPAGSISGLIDETYRFGFYGICNSKGIGDIFSRFKTPYTTFSPGIDHNIYYYNPSISKENPFQIVFYGRPNKSRNAFHIGIESLRIVKKYFGDKVRIISVGDSKWKPKNYNLEGILENVGMLDSLEDVASLYRHSTLGLVFMLTPHPSYQPLEFMATGCITITNRNNSTGWLLKDNINCILTNLFPSDIASKIIQTLECDKLRQELIQGGLDTVQPFTWENAFSEIRSFIINPAR